MAQSVKRPTSAQVTISQFVSSSRFGLSPDSSEPGACFGCCVALSLSLRLPHSLSLSLSLSLCLSKIRTRNKKSLGKNLMGFVFREMKFLDVVYFGVGVCHCRHFTHTHTYTHTRTHTHTHTHTVTGNLC